MAQTKGLKRMSVSPPEVLILGVDTGHKVGDHPLVDERAVALRGATVNMALLHSISKFGFDASKPIRLRKEKVSYVDGDGNESEEVRHVVVDGRNRAMVVRAFNAAQPDDTTHLEPWVIVEAQSETDEDIMIVLNSARSQDSTMMRARRALRLSSVNGKEPEEIATIEGVDAATVRRWLKLCALPKATQKAVDQGKISANVALKILGKLVDTDETAAHTDALKKLLDDHGQTKMAPSIKRAAHLVGGGTPASAPQNSAKPKVGGRHIKLMADYADSGDIELPEGVAELVSALTDPDYVPEGVLKVLLDKVAALEVKRKEAEKAANAVTNKAAAEERKKEREAERAAAKAAKEKEKAAAKAVKLKEKAERTQAAAKAAKEALAEAAKEADLDPADLGIETDDAGNPTSAEGELSL